MLKTKQYNTPLYKTPFTLMKYDSDQELANYFNEVEFDPAIETFDGGVFENDGMLFIVFSQERKGYPSAGIIAHEAKHLVNAIFLDIGHDLDLSNDEPEAYLLQWIVDEIHQFIK